MKKSVIFSVFALFVLLIGGCLTALANEPQGRITAKGTVVDSDNLPVVGAYVVEKGNDRNGAVTDADGRFSIIVILRFGQTLSQVLQPIHLSSV